MASAALLLAVLLAHQYTAAGEIESFSVGGAYLLEDGAAPWLVSLRYSGDRDGRAFKDYPYCGGSVLNATHVLTAARCLKNPAVQDLNSPLLAAQAGSVHRNKVRDAAAQTQPITGFVAHRAYNPNRQYFDQRYDIALAKVAQPFNLTTQVRAVPLREVAAPAGTRCQVYGWGDIVETNGTEYSKGSTRAKFVEVVIVSMDECAAKYNKKVTELQGLVCTVVPDGKKFSCLGDSGGALLCDGQLTGVTPEGVRCGPNEQRPDLPDLHVDTVQLRRWIATGGAPSSATACLLLTLLASATALWWH